MKLGKHFLLVMLIFLVTQKTEAQADMILLDTFSFSGRIIINETDGTIKLDEKSTPVPTQKWKAFKQYYTNLEMQVLELIDFHTNAKGNFENKPGYHIDERKMGELNRLYRINQPDSNYVITHFKKGTFYYFDINCLVGKIAVKKGYGHQVVKKNKSPGTSDTLYIILDVYQ
jgi:hypothetical protein